MYVAGTGGLEPPTYGTKNRCSTTELRPNRIDWQFIAIFTQFVNKYVYTLVALLEKAVF